MRFLPLALLALVPLGTACAPSETATRELDPALQAAALEQGAAAVAPFKRELKTALLEGMARGPVAAIATCRDEAPRIAQTSAAPGVELGRTSHRLRNPANAPRPWVEPLLASYLSGETPLAPRAVGLATGRIGYVEPIRVQGICLACHGERVDPAVAAEIARLYPEDRATGFSEDDLRGLFWAELPAP